MVCRGAVSGRATVFKVIDVNFNKAFQAGTRCYNSPAPGAPPVAQQDVAADQQNQLVQYVKPAASYNYPTDAPVTVKFGLEPDQVFDVSEQQANGTIKNRTFRLDITRSLQVQHPDNNSWSGVMMNTARNNLGEFLYTTIAPAGTAPAGLAGPGIGTGTGSGTSPGGTGATGSGTGSAPSTGIVPGFGLNASVMMQLGASKGVTGSGTGSTSGTTGGTGQAPAGNVATGNGSGPGSGMPGQGGVQIDPAGPGLNIPYPVQPPPPSYGDLPPTSPPPLNNLVQDRNYRFTVTATLKEFKNGAWVNALKADGSPVTQTVTKNFRTGPVPLAPAANLPALTN
jgi:hypothetical protein